MAQTAWPWTLHQIPWSRCSLSLTRRLVRFCSSGLTSAGVRACPISAGCGLRDVLKSPAMTKACLTTLARAESTLGSIVLVGLQSLSCRPDMLVDGRDDYTGTV